MKPRVVPEVLTGARRVGRQGGEGIWGEEEQVRTRTRVGEEAEGRVGAPGPQAAGCSFTPTQMLYPSPLPVHGATFAPLAQGVGTPVDLKSMGNCVAGWLAELCPFHPENPDHAEPLVGYGFPRELESFGVPDLWIFQSGNI